MMKLFVIDSGDESVGIPSVEYVVECPFERDEVDTEDIEYFRNKIQEAFDGFTMCRLSSEYAFEREENDKYEMEN